ncbi:MAG: class I SAM-dependent methyltransferase [Thermoplasmatales archaeon]
MVFNSNIVNGQVDEGLIPDYESSQFTIREKHEDLLERKLISRNLTDGFIAVDLGGGYGRLTDLLLHHFKYVVLIDYSLRNMERAVKDLDSERVLFMLADIRNPPILNGSVDFIMSIRVMHHYPDLDFLGFITNKLRKGGSLLFNANNLSSPMFVLHMMKSLITNGKVGLNLFNPVTQGISDSATRREVYFMKYRNLIDSIPKTCHVERIIGAGMFHNSMIEAVADSLDVERLTEMELHLSEVIKCAKLYPDVFLLLTNEVEFSIPPLSDPLDVVRCVVCGNRLKHDGSTVICENCGKDYRYKGGILDMRNIRDGSGFKNSG